MTMAFASFGCLVTTISCLGVTASAFGPALQPAWRPGRQSVVYPPCSNGNILSQQAKRRQTQSSRLFFGLSSIEKKEAIYLEAAANNPGTTVPEASTEVHIVTLHPNTEDETLYFTEYPRESGQYCLLVFESDMECQYFVDLIEVGVPGGEVEALSTHCTLEEIMNHCQEINVPLQYVPNMD